MRSFKTEKGLDVSFYGWGAGRVEAGGLNFKKSRKDKFYISLLLSHLLTKQMRSKLVVGNKCPRYEPTQKIPFEQERALLILKQIEMGLAEQYRNPKPEHKKSFFERLFLG